MLPLSDSAPRDFNQYAIYNDNAFTGVDRISDANEITMGATSRLLEASVACGARRVVHVSTPSVLYPPPDQLGLRETAPAQWLRPF